MRTVIPDPPPPEIAELLERRHRLGLDHHDEVWEGVYHMAPAPRLRHARTVQQLMEILVPAGRRAGLVPLAEFNLGGPDDFRVPDAGFSVLGPDDDVVYLPTAAIVVEVLSPGDETWNKLPFYARHGVGELVVADPDARTVALLALGEDGYTEVTSSPLLGMTTAELAAAVDWR